MPRSQKKCCSTNLPFLDVSVARYAWHLAEGEMIRKKAWLTGAALTGTIVVTAFGGTAFAADLVEPGCTPAVSSFNGKLEGAGGYSDSDNTNGDFGWEAGASLSLPLGCMFGFQADFGAGERV